MALFLYAVAAFIVVLAVVIVGAGLRDLRRHYNSPVERLARRNTAMTKRKQDTRPGSDNWLLDPSNPASPVSPLNPANPASPIKILMIQPTMPTFDCSVSSPSVDCSSPSISI